MHKILITGALGYIGSHTSLKLLFEGHTVYGLSQNIRASTLKALNKFNNFYFIQGDLKNYNKELPEIDTVIHCAGRKSVLESWQRPELYIGENVGITKNLLEHLPKTVKKIIFISTAMVYKKSVFYSEESARRGDNPYAQCKIRQEEILREYGYKNNINVVILRCFNPIGVHQELADSLNSCTTIVPAIIRALEDKRPLNIYGHTFSTSDSTAVRDYIHIEDVVNFISSTLQGGSSYNVYNVGRGVGVSVKELVQEFEEIANTKIEINFLPARAGENEWLVADISKARQELNYIAQYTLRQACLSVLKARDLK